VDPSGGCFGWVVAALLGHKRIFLKINKVDQKYGEILLPTNMGHANIEYRRTNPHPSLPTSPSHTYTSNHSILLDIWSISRDSTTALGSLCVHRPCQGYTHNPTGLPVHSQGCTYNPTGLPLRSQGCTHTQTPNQDARKTLSPPSRVLCLILHILQETVRPSVCAQDQQVQG